MKYKIIILSIIVIFIYIYYYFNNVKIIYHNDDSYNDKLNDFTLKLRNWYPLNNDHFTIDFGGNYFDFFKTIGTDGLSTSRQFLINYYKPYNNLFIFNFFIFFIFSHTIYFGYKNIHYL